MAGQGIDSRVGVAAGRQVVHVRLQSVAAQSLTTGGRGTSQLAKQLRQSGADGLAGGQQQIHGPAMDPFPMEQSASQTILVCSARVSPAGPHLKARPQGISPRLKLLNTPEPPRWSRVQS